MRHAKILVAVILALSALLLSLLVLNQARADAPGPDIVQQQLVSSSNDLAARDPVTVSLWLMPDFKEKKVWVDGTVSPGHSIGARDLVSGTYHLKRLLPFSEVASWRDHYFGWWEGSQITPSRQLTGAYELRLPGLDLQPDDVLKIRLLSGIILTDTFMPRTITPISPTSTATGTLGVRLDFTATPTAALTGTYTFTGLAISPEIGQFVVSPTVTLTANYALPGPSFSPATGIATQTVTSPPFSYTLDVRGDYSLFSLRSFSQPVTLTVPFYPFEKAIDLTLIPLLVETAMTQTASAIGGSAVRKLRGAEYRDRPILYAQGGLLGRGEIRLRIPTSADDPLRSPVALVSAFRRDYRQEGLNRLLERCLDFPSFPIMYTVGELNARKETIVEVVTTEMSHTAQSDASALTLKAPFQLNVWRAREMPPRRGTLVFTSTSTSASNLIRGDQLYSNAPCGWDLPNFDYASDIYESYDFPDFNRCIGGKGDKQVLQMGLGRIMLGPHDVLTLTIESVAWVSLDPLPDELRDHWQQGLGGPERSGFTAVYRGPRSFWLDIRYTPHPSLFARQSLATIRGHSRAWEYWLGRLWTNLVREPLRSELLFSVGLESIGDLDEDQMPERLSQEFESQKIALSGTVRIRTQETGKRWRIYDSSERYLIVVKENQSLRIYLEHYNPEKEGWVSIIVALVLLLIVWIPYQWTTPKRGEEGSGGEEENKNQDRKRRLGARVLNWKVTKKVLGWAKSFQTKILKWQVARWFLDRLGALRRNWIVHVLLRFCLMLLFLVIGLVLENSFEGGILAEGSRPFAIALVCGALLLLRWEKALLLVVVGVIGIFVDIRLAGQYTSDVQSALAYSSATGMLSGATSVAMLIITLAWVGMLFWWSGAKKSRFQLQHRDLHAFTFFGLAAAVFEVTDASLFAIVWLFGVWLAFSLFLDRARPLRPNQPPVNKAKQDAPPSLQNSSSESGKRAETKSAEPDAKTQSQDSSSDITGPPEGLNKKLGRVRRPAFVFAILVVAIALSRDPLLRAQLASFTQSASLGTAWFMWIFDPFARVATTLIPCIAMVLLVVFLDAALERWRYDRTGKASSSQDIYLKAGLSLLLFPVFMLGIGGLDLFMGTLGLKLSDRIVYYVTVPLLTSIWLDVKAEGLGDLFEKLREYLKDDLQNKIKLVMSLLSMLIPWFASAPVTEQIDQLINTLQTLQF